MEHDEPTPEEEETIQKCISEWCRYKKQETEILNNEIKPIRKILKQNYKQMLGFIKQYPQMAPLKLGTSHTIEHVINVQCPFSKSTVSSFFKPEEVDAYVKEKSIEKQEFKVKKRKLTTTTNQTDQTNLESSGG
jgi:hypothetical protein